jgi:hypothetical protein
MNSKATSQRLILGVLVILALAVGLIFMTNPLPPSPAISAAVPTTPRALSQNQATPADNWPTLSGLAHFGDGVKLLAFTLPTQRFAPGDSLEVTLYWQTQPGTIPYNLFLHLFDANNQLVVQMDAPLAPRFCEAGSQFSAGLVVTCDSLVLSEELATGAYQLRVGVYDPTTGQRLTTSEGESTVSLTTLELETGVLISTTTPPPPCLVTAPNGSAPPGEPPSPDYYSNGQLWTVLWPDGQVIFEPGGPGSINADGSLGMKWGWWRGVEGQLTIEGRRLDAPAPPLRADIPEGYGESGFQVSALIFPTEGCWEVTGRVGETELTFITLVVKK